VERGRGRLGYEISIAANFSGVVNGVEVGGDVDAKEITDHDPAFPVSVECSDGSLGDIAKKSFAVVLLSTLKKVESDLCCTSG